MHELSVCQSLLKTIETAAAEHNAVAVNKVYLAIGPLSGIEALLLEQAWTLAREGTIAAEAVLETTLTPVIVRCRECGHEGEAQVNRLLCSQCGDWRVELISGSEMMLTSLELTEDDNKSAQEGAN